MDSSELQPVHEFIAKIPPFDSLDTAQINQTCLALKVVYYSKNEQLVHVDSNPSQLYIVRTGAFEVVTPKGELIDRISDGQYFGFSGMLSGEKVVNKVRILEDGLVYILPQQAFDQLRANCYAFDRFFNQAFAQRIRHQGAINSEKMSSNRIDNLLCKKIIALNSQATIYQAAQQMSENRVSSLLIIDNEKLVGILTDKDLRNRVLARGLNGEISIAEVMTKEPQTLPANALVFEAILTMSENNIHHLPIVAQEQVIGMLSSTDLMRNQSSQPILLMAQINKQNRLSELVKVSQQIPMLLQNLISSDAKPHEIGRTLTTVTDSLTRRLITLAQDSLGIAPVPFCWLAFGSQARQDQAAGSDQDNALLLARELDNEEKIYFQQLAKMVCDGLNACGFPYCPGEIMASNEKWQKSLQQWQQAFRDWIRTPQPKALLHASIFFDMRAIFGPQELFTQLQNSVLAETKGNDIFLAAMTSTALDRSPPLGFFRDFVVERDGREVKGIDLKHRGNALINDIVRVYALSIGSKEVSTHKRLEALLKNDQLNHQDVKNLRDASEFIAHQRLANQGEQFSNNLPINNYLRPDSLSSLSRHQLKAAFKIVHEAQVGLKLKFLRLY
ncbi:DUF294 nucleotidyltransferase-like domain-containing protein [Psychromonas sp. MME2]|uniref:DUF294 nucleotidyltransferase-like domain-containing protein n=1 Tax=unclassified Psychromonas TaxID=2614957 RepID=UPI00339C8FA9